MLKQIKSLMGELLGADRGRRARRRFGRRHERIAAARTRLWVKVGNSQKLLHLADLSCGGACGFLDQPLDIGETVSVRLDNRQSVEASVCRVERNRVELRFAQPLEPDYVREFWKS